MFRVGSKVRISDEGAENENYARFVGKVLRVTHVSRSTDDHPGFDSSAGSPLYDLETLGGQPVPFSLYNWELERN